MGRVRKIGERRREIEKREEKMKAEREGTRGGWRESEQEGRGEGEVVATTTATHENEGKRGGGTGQVGGGPVH
jgi:hypothetical protein